MDNAWAIEQLESFVRIAAVDEGSGTYRNVYVEGGGRPNLDADVQLIEHILGRVLPDWRDLPTQPGVDGYRKHFTAARRSIAQLKRARELREKLGEAAPQLAASTMHPWVWEAAKGLWQSTHYREAVNAAAIRINAETQSKVGRRDVSEVKLFQESFRVEPPEIGKPRLRRMKDDGSDLYKNLHVGAMTFAQGCYMAVRNPASHEVLDELPEHEALEQLAAFSMLARWVDEATVEKVEDPASDTAPGDAG